MKEEKKIEATYKSVLLGENIGFLEIGGVHIPHKRITCDDPLGKIWSSVRKKVLNDHGVHISATFKYRPYWVECSFIVDHAYGETAKLSDLVLNQRFERAFPYAMADFEDALEAFFEDEENGYWQYVNIVNGSEEAQDEEKCEELFNVFLKKINLRNPVEKYSQEELQMIKDARAKRKEEKKIRKLKGYFRKEALRNRRDFYEEHGRFPTQEEISDLAEIRVKEVLEKENKIQTEEIFEKYAYNRYVYM